MDANQTYGKVGKDLDAVFRSLKNKGVSKEAAFDEFDRLVNLDAFMLDSMAELIQLALTEWVLFERVDPKSGMAYVEHYEARHRGTDRSARLSQVVATQRFDAFWLRSVAGDRTTVTLESVATGETFEVFAPDIARRGSWLGSVVSLRIANVGGHWLQVGKVALRDRNPTPDDGMLAAFRSEGSLMVGLLRQTVGRGGLLNGTVRLV